MKRVVRLLAHGYLVTLLVCCFLIGSSNTAQAQPDLIVNVGDVIAAAGQQNFEIPIYIDNFSDTIAGVALWIRLERPDVAIFQTNTNTIPDTTLWNCNVGTFPSCTDSSQVFDTLFFWRCVPEGAYPSCTDSIEVVDPSFGYDWFTTATYDFIHVADKEITTGNFDTSGTLMSGWEFISTTSLGNQGIDIKIIALADQPGGENSPGFGQQTGGVLINLLADVVIPDDDTDRTIAVSIISHPIDNFSFSDESGNFVGVKTIVDTQIVNTYFYCTNWVDTGGGPLVCFDYMEVPTPPYDSLVVDTIEFIRGELDLDKVFIFDGSLTVLLPPDCICGDANGSESINIADATHLIAYIFTGGASPQCNGQPSVWSGDANASCSVNIADATHIIAYIFLGGDAPAGCCAN